MQIKYLIYDKTKKKLSSSSCAVSTIVGDNELLQMSVLNVISSDFDNFLHEVKCNLSVFPLCVLSSTSLSYPVP
uniref:Uncharacterized protein n=1 Tax=Arion vulgaris TaxID=1028688 RepID=A0A0B7B519_9EUPU